MARRELAAALGLVLAALGALAGPTAPAWPTGPTGAAATGCVVDALLVNSCRPWFGGAADDYPQVGSSKLAQMQYFESRVGRPMDIAHAYHKAPVTALTETELYYARRPGTYLFLNWRVSETTWRAASGGNATLNARIDDMAASIQALGDKKIFLTLSHEPENHLKSDPGCPGLTFVGTSGTPDDYKAMWRNVRTRFDAAGVSNVVWVMDYMNYPPWNCVVNDVYPGDDLVDWIVFNAFQRGDHATDGTTFASQVGNLYDLLTANSTKAHDYLSKPWGIAEWGIHHSGQAAAYRYYAQATAAVESDTFPQLRMFLSYDQTNPNNGDGSLRVGYDAAGVADPAEQAAFNAFAQSPRLNGTFTEAGGDHTPPGAPARLTAAGGVRQVTLSWSPATDDRGVVGYRVSRNGRLLGTTSSPAYVDRGLAEATGYGYAVSAVDAAGNVGDPAATRATTLDTTAPTAPTGLSATGGPKRVTLRWTGATDNVAVTGYSLYRNATRVATLAATATGYTDSGLAPQQAYTYRLVAVDAAGNQSPTSTVSATTT